MSDAAYVLSDYIQSIDNLPSEIIHILDELKDKDAKYMQLRLNIHLRENKIYRHIKQNGSLSENPAESKYDSRISSDYEKIIKIQEEKVQLAEKAQELMNRHSRKLEDEVKKLELEGIVIDTSTASTPNNGTTLNNTSYTQFSRTFPDMHTNGQSIATTAVLNHAASSLMSRSTSQKRDLSTPEPSHLSPSTLIRTHQKRKSSALPRSRSQDRGAGGHGSSTSTNNRSVNGDDDSQVYCFCQQVSFGEMVACDNENCPFEWFHLPCVGLTVVPEGSWYCSNCAPRLKKGT